MLLRFIETECFSVYKIIHRRLVLSSTGGGAHQRVKRFALLCLAIHQNDMATYDHRHPFSPACGESGARFLSSFDPSCIRSTIIANKWFRVSSLTPARVIYRMTMSTPAPAGLRLTDGMALNCGEPSSCVTLFHSASAIFASASVIFTVDS